MAVAFVRDHVQFSSKTAATTLAYTLSADIAAGNLIVACVLFDNFTTASKPIVSSIGKQAGETNNWVLLGAARSTSTSGGAFASGELWAIKTTVLWSAAGAYTVTLDSSVTMRACDFLEFSGAEATLRGTVGTNYSTTTTAASAATTGTAPVVGDLAFGFLFGSNIAAAPASDTDATAGSWSTAIGVGSTGGAAATNNFGIVQYKVLTAATQQTYNSSAAGAAGNGSIVAILQATVTPLVTQAAYGFYADGTETGSTVLGTSGGIGYIANSSTTYASRTNTTITKPTGTLDGHLILIALFTGLAGGSVTPTPPAGFTQIGTPANVTDGSFQGKLWLYYKVASGEGASWNWTHTAQSTQGAAFTYSGVDTTTPIDVTAAESTGTSQTNSWPSVTTVTNASQVIRVGHDWADGTTRGTPAGGYTNRLNGTILFLWDVAQPTAGATGVVTAANANLTGTEPWSSWTVALRPAASSATTVDVSSGDVNLGVRMRLQETAGGVVPATDDWQLQWEKNASGTWANVASNIIDRYDLANGDANSQINTTSVARAESFKGTGQPLSAVDFSLSLLNSPTGTLSGVLYAHDGGTYGGTGLPTGSPLATSTNSVAASSLTTTPTVTTFTFDGTFTPTAGTPYFIGLLASGASAAPNNVFVRIDSSSPSHPGSGVTYNGTTWSASTELVFEVRSTFVSSTAVPYDSSNLTDAAATTNRLGAGTGTFVAGKISEDGLVDDVGWSASNFTELLYSITLKQANLANSDALRFRVLRNGVTTSLTYASTPTINVTAAAAPSLPPRNTYINNPANTRSFNW